MFQFLLSKTIISSGGQLVPRLFFIGVKPDTFKLINADMSSTMSGYSPKYKNPKPLKGCKFCPGICFMGWITHSYITLHNIHIPFRGLGYWGHPYSTTLNTEPWSWNSSTLQTFKFQTLYSCISEAVTSYAAQFSLVTASLCRKRGTHQTFKLFKLFKLYKLF